MSGLVATEQKILKNGGLRGFFLKADKDGNRKMSLSNLKLGNTAKAGGIAGATGLGAWTLFNPSGAGSAIGNTVGGLASGLGGGLFQGLTGIDSKSSASASSSCCCCSILFVLLIMLVYLM